MRGCIVPGCRTGYKSVKIKCSAFKVPKNEVMRKKWEVAIPGIETLKDTQCVCEKHFEAHCIIRKWEKSDIGGNVIASIQLQRPRLKENAVPTLFDVYAQPTFPLENTTIDTHLIENVSTNDATNLLCEIVTDTCHEDVEYCYEDKHNLNDHGNVDDNYKANEVMNKDKRDVLVKCITPNFQYKRKTNEESQIIDVALIHLEHNYTEKDNSSSELISGDFPYISTKFMKTSLPRSWSVKEKSFQGVKHWVFMFTIDRKMNGIETPVIQRCIMVNRQSSVIRYFVHGVEVENLNSELFSNTLEHLTSLPEILLKFQRTRICQGFGDLGDHFANDVNSYKDVLNDWRHKQCTLLSEHKKCDFCRKFRKILIQRQARARARAHAVNGNGLKKIRSTCNEIDEEKVNAIKTKLNIERHEKNWPLHEVKKFKKTSHENDNNVEIMDKCSGTKLLKLGIDELQKLNLTKKNVTTINNNGQNCEYNHEWITFCKSVNSEPPVIYKLLKSNNVTSLPSGKSK